MSKIAIIFLPILLGVILTGCRFGEYSQTIDLPENVDDYRTGCEIDSDALMAGYKQYDANRYYTEWDSERGEPTPTPEPITSDDLGVQSVLLEAWKAGCMAGRTDAVRAEQATLMGLKDELAVLAAKIAALEPTPTPTPTPEPTESP